MGENKREGMTYEEYKVMKQGKPGEYEVTNSYGVYDYFKYYRHNRPKDLSYYKMNEAQYYKLIRTVNEYLVDLLFKNAILDFPNRLGQLILMKYPARLTFKDGKLHTNLPIDWKSTIMLWFDDPEAEKKKTLIRHEQEEIYTIAYRKRNMTCRNMPYYDFRPIRKVKQRVAEYANDQDGETPFFFDATTNNINKLYNG